MKENSPLFVFIAFIIKGSAVLCQQVYITDTVYQQRPHFKITTPAATYLFDRKGGGFSGIIDKDGADWISYKNDTAAASYPASAGNRYRGLPNAVFGNEDGGVGHPGFDKAVSEQSGTNEITTNSISGKWQWTWTFYREYAVWNITKTDTSRFYWLLYEGTVGGKWNNISDKYWGSSNTMNGRMTDFYKNQALFAPASFLYFGDKTINRIFYMVQKEPDGLDDIVGWLGNETNGMLSSPDGMVVAGLGRNKDGKPTMQQANTFRIGFIERKITGSRQYRTIKKMMQQINF
jgi:hypothetical protein